VFDITCGSGVTAVGLVACRNGTSNLILIILLLVFLIDSDESQLNACVVPKVNLLIQVYIYFSYYETL
jgi:hypothetical protein